MYDPLTLSFAATVSALAFALSMNLLRYLLPHEAALKHWSTAALLFVVGLLLQAQRGHWPDEATWLLANTLIMIAGAHSWQGSASLAERPLPHWFVSAAAVGSGVVNLAIHLTTDGYLLRVGVLSAFMFFCFAGSGWAFLQYGRQKLISTARATCVLFWLGALMYLFRMLHIQDQVPTNGLQLTKPVGLVVPLVYAIVFFNVITAVITYIVSDKLRSRLQIALNMAERSDLAKSAFLASITHELRTPLNAISGFAQLMKHEKQYPAEVRQSASLIQNAGNQLLDVVNDLMDLRALQEGTLNIKFEISHVQQLVDQVLEEWHLVARQQGTTLTVQGVASNITIWVDPVRFRQVLRNLVSNAFKFNRVGGEIRVNWFDDGESMMITVSDSGPGIPEALRHRVFGAFDRLGAESGDIPGTGIGLTICRQLVQMMGGHIDLKNNPDQGCTFWIRFPQAVMIDGEVTLQTSGTGDMPVDSDFPSTRVMEKQPPSIPEGKQVLYVEDNLTNQKLVQAVFQKQLGLEVTLALTAEEGLAIARERLPNLILMDLNLPGMDGYSALKALRADPATRHIPVMAVTAQSRPEDLEKGRAAGFDAYLTKPLKLGNLIAQAMQLLKR